MMTTMKTLLAVILAIQVANPCLICPTVGVADEVETDPVVSAITACAQTHHGTHRSECRATMSAINLKSPPTSERLDTDMAPMVSVAPATDDDCGRLSNGLPASLVSPCTSINPFTVLRI
jgi:hypothetical protein